MKLLEINQKDLIAMNDIHNSLDMDDMSACYFVALILLANDDDLIKIHNEIVDELSDINDILYSGDYH